MKKLNIIILAVLLCIIAISFVLLLSAFNDSLSSILKTIVESILTSCLIALPSYCLLIYHSYQNANQSISDLLMKIYWVLQTKLSASAQYDATTMTEIVVMLSNASIRIGQIREDSFVSKKYNDDELTEHIASFSCACQKYLCSRDNEKGNKLQQIMICKAKIINTICKIESFEQSKNNTV